MATQSAQISSSQGLADGSTERNPAKEPKFSDSFLSSSPVSLIQSSQADNRVQQGPCMTSDGVDTSLHFSPQSNMFTPSTHGSEAPGVVSEHHFIKDKENSLAACGIDLPLSGCSSPVSSILKFSGPVKSSTAPPRQDISPIKISPVSERIKALEALVAKQNDPDTWSDGGVLHFKERHFEKSPTESSSRFLKKEVFPDQDSPESPFEVLGDTRRSSDFEDTADWMRAYLPPAPNFETVPELSSSGPSDFVASEGCDFEETQVATALVASVPDAFMDVTADPSFQKDHISESVKQTSTEEDSEFDLSFLPTAYIWDKQERTDPETKVHTNVPMLHDSKPPPSPPPPAGFGSPTPPPSPPSMDLETPEFRPTSQSSDSEPAEVIDMESSGESDDTVIEDAVPVLATVSSLSSSVAVLESIVSVASSVTDEVKNMQSANQENQSVLVPIINVIETDEQPFSDEEEDSFEVVKEPVKEQPRPPEPKSEVELKWNKNPVTEGLIEKDAPHGQCPPLPAHSGPITSEYQEQSSTAQSDSGTALYDQKKTSKSLIQNEPSTTSTELLSKEITEDPLPLENSDHLDVLQAQCLNENTENLNELCYKSSFDTESTEIITEKYDLIDQGPDLSKQTLSSFDSDTYSCTDTAENPCTGLASTLTGKPEPASFQEDLLLKDSQLQKNPNNTEYVPHCAEEINSESSLTNIPGVLVDMELGLDYEIESSSSEMNVQTQNELLPAEEALESRNVSEVTSEDLLLVSIGGQSCPQDIPQDLFSGFSKNSSDTQPQLQKLEPDNSYSEERDDSSKFEKLHEEPTSLYGGDILSPLESGSVFSVDVNQQKSEAEEQSPEASDPESVEPESSVSATTDSFVEFMKECLKSQQDEDPIDICTPYTSKMELPKTGAPSSHSSPTMVLDLEQECLTIRALKELGSSQEDEDLPVPEVASQATIGQQQKYPLPASEQQTTVIRTPPPVSPFCTPPLDACAAEEVPGIDAWVADAYYLAEHVLAAVLTHLSAKDLVYWRDPKKSGVVFGVSLLLLLSLAAFSVISVVSYLLLALLCVTISFRIYKSVIQAVQKSSEGHPFKAIMDKDVSVPPETFRKHVDMTLSYINRALKRMSRLFLVEDLVDSLKLAVAMWLLTYVGAVFNGITILILADILIFTLPLVYEKNKTQIDNYVGIVRTQFNTVVSKIQEKLPGLKRKAE